MMLRTIKLRDANAYITRVHRHSAKVVGHKFSVAAWKHGAIVGVAIVGRPIAPRLDDGATLEVLRVATEGAHNACSFLYGAAAKAAWALGYRKIITYTLARESGNSLRGAGWAIEADAVGGGSWATHGRKSGAPLLEHAGLPDPRKHDHGPKTRWARFNNRREGADMGGSSNG